PGWRPTRSHQVGARELPQRHSGGQNANDRPRGAEEWEMAIPDRRSEEPSRANSSTIVPDDASRWQSSRTLVALLDLVLDHRRSECLSPTIPTRLSASLYRSSTQRQSAP